MTHWADLFTNRQLTTLTTLSDLAAIAVSGVPAVADGGRGPDYGRTLSHYLAMLVSNCADDLSSIVTWRSSHGSGATRSTFARQALPMTWDFAEANPFAGATGDPVTVAGAMADVLVRLPLSATGSAVQSPAASTSIGTKVVSTDPPYYDNVGYANLSDFFYVWLRRSLRSIYPDLVATLVTPKAEELVADPARDGGKAEANKKFEQGSSPPLRRSAKPIVKTFRSRCSTPSSRPSPLEGIGHPRDGRRC